MAKQILIPGEVLEKLIDIHEEYLPSDIDEFEKEYPEYAYWSAELDQDSGKFDAEKGARYDFKIVVTDQNGTEYEGTAGYQNMNGWEFTSTYFTEKEPALPKEKKKKETLKLLAIRADTNDADYVTEITVVTQEDLDMMLPLINAVINYSSKPGYEGKHNWEANQYSQNPPYKAYAEFGREVLDMFAYYVPTSENGVHSIEDISIIEVSKVTNLFGNAIQGL